MVGHLDRTILRNVDLRGADLNQAVLRGADLPMPISSSPARRHRFEGTRLAGTIKGREPRCTIRLPDFWW